MIKILGIIMVLLSSTGLGFLAAEKKKQRIKQLKELRQHMKVLYGEIEYGRTMLPEALAIVASRNKGDLTGFFEGMVKELNRLSGESFSIVWRRVMKETLSLTCLEKKDLLLLENLGENLGFLDQKMQLSTIGQYLMTIEEVIREGSEELKEKVRIYNLLGVLGGIFVVIVMI